MAEGSAKKTVKYLDKIVDYVVIAFLLSLILYGGFSMWDTNQMYSRASSANYTVYRPTHNEALGFEQLQAINPNVFGWITVFGTHIDYPLLQDQGGDNRRYEHTNARGEPSMSGAIFLDVRNDNLLTDFNNIIYGHDMTRNAMFGELERFGDEYFFESRRFGTIFNGITHYGIEFFAFLPADAHDMEIYNPNIVHPDDRQQLIDRLMADAILSRPEINVTIEDRIVILSTCTQMATNGRLLLVGRLMTDVPHDAFEGIAPVRGAEFLAELGTGAIFLLLFFLIGLTILITMLIFKRRQRKRLEKEGLLLNPEMKRKRKETTLKSDIIYLGGKMMAIAVFLAILFSLVFGMVTVNESAMQPSMHPGDVVLFQRFGAPNIANDIVVVDFGYGPVTRRVVAVGGDTIDITERGLIVNGHAQQEIHSFEPTEQFAGGIHFPIILADDEVFVLGDARARSRDSRIYGPIRRDNIMGTVVTVIRN